MMIKHYCDKCGREIIGQVYKAEIRCRKLLSMDNAEYDLDEKCAREMVGESAIAQHAEKEAERTARRKEREQKRAEAEAALAEKEASQGFGEQQKGARS